MKIEDKIRNHLRGYRMDNGKTQKEMALLIGVSYATYQEMESKGIVRKLDGLQKLKDKTGFVNTHENMYDRNITNEKTELELLRQRVKDLEKIISLQEKLIPKEDNPQMKSVNSAG